MISGSTLRVANRQKPHKPEFRQCNAQAAGLAGKTRELREADLRQKWLGDAAVDVWLALLAHRDVNDATSRLTARRMLATIPSLKTSNKPGRKNQLAVPHEKIRWVLGRLRAFGLIETMVGPQWHDFINPSNGQSTSRKLMCRIVRGAYSANEGIFSMPKTAADDIESRSYMANGKTKKWGGKRAKTVKAASPNHTGLLTAEGGVLGSQIDQEPHPLSRGADTKNPTPESSLFDTDDLNLSVTASKAAKAAEPVGSEVLRSACGAVEGGTKLPTSTGTRIGSSTTSTPSKVAVMPSELFFGSLKPATVPSPPKLKEGMSEDDQLQMMLRAYRGATESRFKGGRSKFAMATRAIDRKQQDKMLATAALLLDSDISPFGWAAFSCDVWKRNHRNPPRLDWVFLISRVEQRSGWFKSELSDYSGERVVFGPKARALMRRHETFRMLLNQTKTDEQVELVTRGFFPGNLFEELLEEARAEGDSERIRLRAEIDKGSWLWG